MDYKLIKSAEVTHKGKLGKWYHGHFREKPGDIKPAKAEKKEKKVTIEQKPTEPVIPEPVFEQIKEESIETISKKKKKKFNDGYNESSF